MLNKQLQFLIKKLKNKEIKYFDIFYDLTKKSVYYIISKIINDKEKVLDIMQDSYIKFLNNINKIDETKNCYSYLLTIAKNTALNEYNKSTKIIYDDYIEIIEDNANDFLKLDCPLIYYCKTNLTKEEFEILELTIILGYRRVEVAKLLNKPVSTINWQYNKIVKKVKNFYKEVYSNEN